MKKNLNILFPPLLFLLIGLFLLIIVQFSVWRIIFALTVSGWDSSWPVLLFARSLFRDFGWMEWSLHISLFLFFF